MSKINTTALCLLLLLLFASFTHAARPLTSSISQPLSVDVQVEAMNTTEKCEGVGEEECLMRRTLAAHLDYIYTQGKKKP